MYTTRKLFTTIRVANILIAPEVSSCPLLPASLCVPKCTLTLVSECTPFPSSPLITLFFTFSSLKNLCSSNFLSYFPALIPFLPVFHAVCKARFLKYMWDHVTVWLKTCQYPVLLPAVVLWKRNVRDLF